MTYLEFYSGIIKPFYAPPAWVFSYAWGIIYPLIAVAAIYLTFLIYKNKASTKLVTLFVFNMIANIMFTPILLKLQNNLIASFDILVVFVTLSLFQGLAWKDSKLLFVTMLPYFIWVIFATFLQLNITWMNLL